MKIYRNGLTVEENYTESYVYTFGKKWLTSLTLEIHLVQPIVKLSHAGWARYADVAPN